MKNLGILAAAGVGLAIGGARAGAQITEVSRTPLADAAQLTFGYLCGDRFVIRNDGAEPVTLEYGVEKGTEHTKLTLNGREAVELESRSRADVELWMDGKLIAKAEKEKRSCKDVPGAAGVTVAPLEVNERPSRRDVRMSAYAYGPPYGYYDPWAFSFYYGSARYRPYGFGIVSRPIVVVRHGGRRR